MFPELLTKYTTKLGVRLCKYRGKPFAENIEMSVDNFHRMLNNVNFQINTNGELRVLHKLAEIDPKCIFDVGANKGDWSQIVSKLYPSCTIHAFEIVPSTYEELTRNTKELHNVIPNNFGLSDEEGVISIALGTGTTTATNCRIKGMQFHEEFYTREIECETRKASDYLKERNIESIDFLKIDVEGMDLKVIKGFGDQIKIARIVQFEYGIFNIASHDLLSDFCFHFKSNGFVVGKIFPKSVKWFDYHMFMENFHGSNYLAVRKNENRLINELAQFSA